MDVREYIELMKELGWDEAFINNTINDKEEAAKKGIIIPLEMHLFEAPTNHKKCISQ